MNRILGIDLGTTNSSMAIIEDGKRLAFAGVPPHRYPEFVTQDFCCIELPTVQVCDAIAA